MIPALQQAAFDPTLRGRRLQVYIYLCSHLDVSEFRHVKFAAEARSLGIRRQHLSSAITHLIERGYLEAKLDDGDLRRHIYRLKYSVSLPGRKSAA